MKFGTMVAALAILVSPSAFAQLDAQSEARRKSADFLLSACKGYMAGHQRIKDVNDALLQGECGGIVKTLIFFSEDLPPKVRFCMPREVTNGQAVRVIVAFMNANPSRLHEDFKTIAGEALHNVWPCS
ncbi:Rap1a/Tai family immunity protein [Microvirga sp. 0TCS3.31]